MKVSVNLRLCAGHGLCAAAAPAVFKVNDNWLADILIDEPPESMREAVEKAARYCPVKAITIADSDPNETEAAATDAPPNGD